MGMFDVRQFLRSCARLAGCAWYGLTGSTLTVWYACFRSLPLNAPDEIRVCIGVSQPGCECDGGLRLLRIVRRRLIGLPTARITHAPLRAATLMTRFFPSSVFTALS
jgi:hypothetical protein